ncbi:MAG TPA: SBBP repeat-containing protein [Terriglobia bacterium]|nr:SBBP repeat-containing protein [Terriglobia bacterium]
MKSKCSTGRGPSKARWAVLRGRRLAGLSIFGLALIGLGLALSKTQGPSPRDARNPKAWSSRYAQLPLSFEANHGQTDSRVKFLARGQNYTLFLTGHEAVLSLSSGKSGRAAKHPASSAVVRFRLLGSAPAAPVTGQDLLPGTSNYFLGNDPSRWHTGIPNYASVRYHQVYPGIDLVYHGNEGQLENDFVVSAGSDPNLVRIGLAGVDGLRLDRSGNLALKVDGGEVQLRKPRAYQGKNEVPVSYVLRAGNEVGLRLGAYDHRQQLVIDPVLAYSTYFGGSGGDIGYGIAVDSAGDAYITGISNSANFPTSTGSQSGAFGGGGDAFVVKLNPVGTASSSSSTPQRVYSTFLGGSGTDSGNAIAVDAGGDAYVTGSTNSSDFTTTTGAFQTVPGGGSDAFVAELNSTGAGLVYSSYLGGSGDDAGQGIAVDSSNNAYVTGSTQSPNFPTLNPLPAHNTNAGSSDAFIAKVNFTGTALLYSTYLGGAKADVGQSIKVDGSGNAYVAGYTFSNDFPIQGPVQGSNLGTVNAFVTELNSAGSAITFSTYLGGSGDDRAFGLALDSSGNIYIAGGAQSNNFPTTVGVFQGANHGQSDAFVAKINPAGPTLVYSTLLGGSGVDQANGIAVDSSGDAFITGFTNSSPTDFPLFSPIQSTLGISGGSSCGASACSDAFVSELNPAATALIESTYLGGSGADFGQAIALGPTGIPYITGTTASTNFPASAGAFQASLTGVAGNAFVAEIKPDNAAGISVVPQLVDFGNQTLNVRSAIKTVAVTNEGTAPLNITQITFTETDTGGTTDFAETDNCVGTVAASGGACNINITFTPGSAAAKTGTFSITDSAAGSPHTISVKGAGVSSATAVTVTPSSLSFGNVTVGAVSTAQSVTITNTGTQTLTFTGISAGGDFSSTNTCTTNVLNVGQSCTASVTFSPTVSGARGGSLSISDNAAGSPQSVVLSGTGVAQFTMSSPSPNVTTLIGSGSTTFTVAAAGPSSFTGSITLACPGGLSCSFNPANIFAGQTSTLTVSGLTASMANPFVFAVTGTSGSQAAAVNLNLLFADYALSASPALNTIVAGSAATYTIAVNPINGFNSQVQLACGNGMPPGATCTFSHSSVTPSGGAATVTLSLQTTKNAGVPPPPAVPPGMVPPLMVFLLVVVLAGLVVLRRRRNRFPRLAGRRWVLVQVSTLCLLIVCETFLVSCRSTPTATGSTTGNYIITINGTLGSNSAVVRTATIDLSVT